MSSDVPTEASSKQEDEDDDDEGAEGDDENKKERMKQKIDKDGNISMVPVAVGEGLNDDPDGDVAMSPGGPEESIADSDEAEGYAHNNMTVLEINRASSKPG